MAIDILTSLPGDAGRKIICEWDLVTPLHAVPERHDFGRIDLRVPASGRLELWDRGIALCRRCEVRVEGIRDLIAARFEPDLGVHWVDRHVDGDISPGEDRRMGVLRLDLGPQAEAGSFTRYVRVVVRCGDLERGNVSIPVGWSVSPRIEVRPSRLWLGTTPPGGRITRRVIVRANDGSAFRVAAVAAKSGPIQASGLFSADKGLERPVDLVLVAPESSGIQRGQLEIAIEGDAGPVRIILPVSLTVRRE